MAISFDITTPTNTLILDSKRQAKASFTVTNTSGIPVQARARVIPDDPATQSWFAILGEADRTFAPEQASQYTVNVAAPENAPAGTYTFRLAMVEEEDPDGNFYEGPSVSFAVREPPLAPLPRNLRILLIILAILAVLVILGLLGWAIFSALSQRAPVTATAAQPAMAEHNGVLYLVYRSNEDTTLYWARYRIADKVWETSRPVPVNNARTPTAPALVEYDGTLYLMFRGDQDERLYMTTYDILLNRWSDVAPVRDTDGNDLTTRTSPALAEWNGRLYLAHRGAADTRIFFTQKAAQDADWTPELIVSHPVFSPAGGSSEGWASTLTAPLLIQDAGRLNLFYLPLGRNNVQMLRYDLGAFNWQLVGSVTVVNQDVSPGTYLLPEIPAIVLHGNAAYMVHQRDPHALYFASTSLAGFRRNTWEDFGAITITTEDDKEIVLASSVVPALAEHDGVLYLIHTGGLENPELHLSMYDTRANVEERRWVGNRPVSGQ